MRGTGTGTNTNALAGSNPGLALATIITCIIITTSKDIDIGGLGKHFFVKASRHSCEYNFFQRFTCASARTFATDWPYISDTGRDGEAYIIFAVGLTVCIMLCIPYQLPSVKIQESDFGLLQVAAVISFVTFALVYHR
jgi:hypothetical protein